MIPIGIYNDVVDPFLKSYKNDNPSIIERLTDPHCREFLVRFAWALADKKQIKNALRIIRVFLNDPDPNTQLDAIKNGEEPNNLRSVRVLCGLALEKCFCLEGREEISEVIKLLKELMTDKNYDVIYWTSSALSKAADTRLRVLPENKEVLFFNDCTAKALKMSKEVEGMAFDFLKRFASWNDLIQKAMVKSLVNVFNPINALNFKDAYLLISSLTKFNNEVMAKFGYFFIYYAELRKNLYVNWKFSIPGFYDDLGPEKYDDEVFKKILMKTIQRLQKENPSYCFDFAAYIEFILRENSNVEMDPGIYDSLAFEYFTIFSCKYDHHVFNVIYRAIVLKLVCYSNKKDLEKWCNLAIKCLKKEKEFINSRGKNGPHYMPFDYSEILILIYEKFEEDKFIEALEIYADFENVQLCESDKFVSILSRLALEKTNRVFLTKVIEKLLKRNPIKYFELCESLPASRR